MSVDERLRRGLREAAAAPHVDTDAALVEVETMSTQVKTRRGILLGVAAAAAAVAGLVWGPGLLDTLGGVSDTPVAGPTMGPAEVLAAYEEARNARDFDAMRALYADDAVITGHPMDDGESPRTADVNEVMLLEESVPSAAQSWFVEVEVSGDQATFTQLFRWNGCHSTPGDQVTVTDGKITSYTWAATRAMGPCTPEQLAEAGVQE
jgi:ketosteroid isomerase-like protein